MCYENNLRIQSLLNICIIVYLDWFVQIYPSKFNAPSFKIPMLTYICMISTVIGQAVWTGQGGSLLPGPAAGSGRNERMGTDATNRFCLLAILHAFRNIIIYKYSNLCLCVKVP